MNYAAVLYRSKLSDGMKSGVVRVRIVPSSTIGGLEWQQLRLEAEKSGQKITWAPIESESQADAERAYNEEME